MQRVKVADRRSCKKTVAKQKVTEKDTSSNSSDDDKFQIDILLARSGLTIEELRFGCAAFLKKLGASKSKLVGPLVAASCASGAQPDKFFKLISILSEMLEEEKLDGPLQSNEPVQPSRSTPNSPEFCASRKTQKNIPRKNDSGRQSRKKLKNIEGISIDQQSQSAIQ